MEETSDVAAKGYTENNYKKYTSFLKFRCLTSNLFNL